MALTGKATESATHFRGRYPGWQFLASFANDGNFQTHMVSSGGKCAIARSNPPVWWQVELHKVYEINKVAITAMNYASKYLRFTSLFFVFSL